MTVLELIEREVFPIVYKGTELDREVTTPFCCDLLSIAMSKMPNGAAWVTIMGNLNTLAVAALDEASCIILAEGISLDEGAMQKLPKQGITVFATELPIFQAAMKIQSMMDDSTIL